jgi:O-antigen ligase
VLFILASRPASLWVAGRGPTLGIEYANEQTGSAIDQLFFVSVLFVSFIVTTVRGTKWIRILAANRAIILFYLYFATSILWSSDPIGSTKRIIKDFGLLFVAGVIYSEKNPLEALRAVYVRCAFILLPLSIVFIKYFPVLGRSYGIAGEVMLTGVTTQKNSLGEIVLIFGLFLLWDFLESRVGRSKLRFSKIRWDIVLTLLLGLQLLRLSQSKTALVCAVVGVFLVLRTGRLRSTAVSWAALAGALTLPLLVFFSQEFSSIAGPIMHALGRDMTFTGRTSIWQHITIDTVNPLIGYGYWNFWGGPGGHSVNQAMHEVIPNAHSGYVDTYLDGGIIGLFVLAILVSSCGKRIIAHMSKDKGDNRFLRVRLAFVVVAIIYNLSESTFARIGPIWFTTLLMMADFPTRYMSRRRVVVAKETASIVFPQQDEIPVGSRIF